MKIPAFLVAFLLFLGGISNTAKAEDVDLQLVLAIDVSSSVNYDEFALQMNGYAAAFRDPKVVAAIASGGHKKVAVAMIQWAGLDEQVTVLDWTVISSAGDAEAFAEKIEYLPRVFPYGGTAITPALAHAYALLTNSPHRAVRRVIDLSGDGEISLGAPPNGIRDQIAARGVTINGLPILNEMPELDQYYSDNVIGGAGAFIEVAADFKDFSRAIAKKLEREIKALWFGM